jgi:hypothetical protein
MIARISDAYCDRRFDPSVDRALGQVQRDTALGMQTIKGQRGTDGETEGQGGRDREGQKGTERERERRRGTERGSCDEHTGTDKAGKDGDST